jgi:rhodanese-related sulfurtransferase
VPGSVRAFCAPWVGWILGPAVHDFLRILADLGFWGLVATMAVVATYVLSKLWTRRKYATAMKRDGISIDDLLGLLRDGAPTVVDARATFGDGAPRIPGAIQFNERTVREDFAGVAHDTVIVVYCDCPNEASAILVSRKLKARGFKFVRPLRGGLQSCLACRTPVLDPDLLLLPSSARPERGAAHFSRK